MTRLSFFVNRGKPIRMDKSEGSKSRKKIKVKENTTGLLVDIYG